MWSFLLPQKWQYLRQMLKQPVLISSGLDLSVLWSNCRTYDNNISWKNKPKENYSFTLLVKLSFVVSHLFNLFSIGVLKDQTVNHKFTVATCQINFILKIDSTCFVHRIRKSGFSWIRNPLFGTCNEKLLFLFYNSFTFSQFFVLTFNSYQTYANRVE